MDPFWKDFLLGLGTNFLATLIGVLVAIYLRDRWYYRRLYDGWLVRILYDDREVLPGGRSIGWTTAKTISESTAEESVLLKGIVSPYARLHCDLITEGRDTGILREVDIPRTFLGHVRGKQRTYTIDLSQGEKEKLLAIEPLTRRILGIDAPQPAPPTRPIEPAAAQPAILLNFAHPLSREQLATIERLAGQSIAELRDEPTQTTIDPARPLVEQITTIIDGFGLSPVEWQTRPILVNPPAYAPATAATLAELHGRMGYFPSLIRLRPVVDSTPTRYEVAEIINLKTIRDASREKRA